MPWFASIAVSHHVDSLNPNILPDHRADLTDNKKRVYIYTRIIGSTILLLFAVPWLADGFYPLLLISLLMSCFSAQGVIDAHILHICAKLVRPGNIYTNLVTSNIALRSNHRPGIRLKYRIPNVSIVTLRHPRIVTFLHVHVPTICFFALPHPNTSSTLSIRPVVQGKNLYGHVRLWGAVSWGLGAFFMGLINDRYGFEYNFILFGILSAATILLVQFKIPDREYEEDHRKVRRTTAM
eukprot:1177897-Prorocentrum_minimum.AAC.2